MELVGVNGDALPARLGRLERLRLRALTTDRIVYATATAYALLFVFAAGAHWFAYQAGLTDLGSMAQALWSSAHGHLLHFTSQDGKTAGIRLGSHVDPILLAFVPLWWIWSSPLMLLVVQAIAVSAGALPVFWLGRKHLASERAAMFFAFAYLLYPATQFNTFTIAVGFHAVSLAIPLLLLAIWFLDEERLLAFAIVAVLAVMCKEEIAAAIGCLGIWYAIRKGHRAVGATICVVGLAISAFEFAVVIPHFAKGGVDPFAYRYAAVGSTPGGILHKAVTDPGAIVHAVVTGHKLAYLAVLFLPFLGLWAFEPLLLLGALPDLAINLLSSKGDQTSIPYHWTAGIVPFVVAASVMGAARIKRDPSELAAVALIAVGLVALYSPIYFVGHDVRLALPSSTRTAKSHALALVPQGASVTASEQLAGYLSSRREIYVFPRGLNAAWAVIDRNDSSYQDVASSYRRSVARLNANPYWTVVYASHGVEVLRRKEIAR
ncbi:MAG TPA: DUF2079 domain-containing protein [Gaiellaceae bacterium]|jgi:uncharacterized membrane protein